MTKFHSLIACTSRNIGNMCITIDWSPGCDVIEFDNFNQAVLLHDQKVMKKKLNIL